MAGRGRKGQRTGGSTCMQLWEHKAGHAVSHPDTQRSRLLAAGAHLGARWEELEA